MRSKEKAVSKSKKVSKQNISSKEAIKHLKYQGTIQIPKSKKIVVHPSSILHMHKEKQGDYILKFVRSTTKKDQWGGYELETIPASKEVSHDLHKKSVDVYVAMEEQLIREVIKKEGQEDRWLAPSGWTYTPMFYDPEENSLTFEFTRHWDTWRTIEVIVYPDRYAVKVSVHIDGDSTESGKTVNFIPYHRKNVKKQITVVRAINQNMYVDWAGGK